MTTPPSAYSSAKTRNLLVAEYALSGIGNDRSTYFQAPRPAPIRLPRHSRRRRRALPEPLDTCLPSIEVIEAELGRIGEID